MHIGCNSLTLSSTVYKVGPNVFSPLPHPIHYYCLCCRVVAGAAVTAP